ncbi:protease synthase and sporulation protein PAI 2 [mine drainage metagenome]|uniref:Protease synthase and sporulation protein PAI 2 n=1 Tax=mine drainage metagenome TaxID=410659 RepID=A0A1J5PMU7_9ZZZZ
MYSPTQFIESDRHRARELMLAYPFASLISCDDDGLPYVTALPLHVQEVEENFLLLGHCARSNHHWRYLQARPQATVVFTGPQAFMSTRVYPDLARVPTWNYLLVQCRVQARLIEQFEDKDALLKFLIGDHDPAYAAQWRSLGQEFQQKMMAGIVGFELAVTDLQCKFKLNQHRPESHAAMYDSYCQGNDHERALAAWMQRLGLVPDDTRVA